MEVVVTARTVLSVGLMLGFLSSAAVWWVYRALGIAGQRD